MRFVYTKYGIVTEERAAELQELDTCGGAMDECGFAGEMEPIRMGGFPDSKEPVKVIVVSGDSMLGEGGMDGPEGSPGYSSNQGVVGVGPQGIPGSAAGGNPGGANTVRESFNQYAEFLLESWLEEELHGDQDELDLDDDGKIEASDLKLLRRGLKDKHVGSDRKR